MRLKKVNKARLLLIQRIMHGPVSDQERPGMYGL